MGVKKVSGKIHLADIPYDQVYLELTERSVSLVHDIVVKSGLVIDDNLKQQIYRLKKSRRISLGMLRQISRILDIGIRYFEKNILSITSVRNTRVGIRDPKLPFDLARPEGVRLISALMGDGGLSSLFLPRYNNQDKELIDSILGCFRSVFGDIDHKLYPRDDKTYQLAFPKIAGLILTLVGVRPGYKSSTNYGIPDFIKTSPTKKRYIFIRQFYSDEGNVRLKDRRLQVKQTTSVHSDKVTLRKNPYRFAHKVLIDLHDMLEDLGIRSKISLGAYRKEDKKADWELSIYGKDELEKFKKHIGFYQEYKNILLSRSLSSYIFPSAARNQTLGFALECFRNVQDRTGYATKHLLAKASKRSLKTATYYLIDLKKRGLIEELDRPRDAKGHFLPRRYIQKTTSPLSPS